MAKIHVCDICGKEKEIFFKCRIKCHTLHFDYGEAFDDPMFFRSEICEECLKKLIEMRNNAAVLEETERRTDNENKKLS